MSNIIEGYKYDIFISYRQKDNKGDRWVSEFVDALKDELESTFKEEISVYFDINPHNGLLETHDVDESLKEKLKCLVFIPVISRTYCDPKSFAWEHEFKAFVELASADHYGLKVYLSNGNVASRVLPILIYDLDPEDSELCQSVLGGSLRGVDFIYKSPGVNRPLRINEDHPQDNQNKTYYRDQINKVANAINEIIRSLRSGNNITAGEKSGTYRIEKGNKQNLTHRIKLFFKRPKVKRILLALLAIIICIPIFLTIYKNSYRNKTENSFAFIRLLNLNKDSTLVNESANFIESVNEKLYQVKEIRMVPFLRDHFHDTEKSLEQIRKELNVNYILDGVIRHQNNEIRISLTFSAARQNEVLFTKPVNWKIDDADKIIYETVMLILNKMAVELSPEEQKNIWNEPSANPEVNYSITNANIKLKNAWDYYNYRDKILDSVSFNTAVEAYNKILEEEPTIAETYAKRAIARAWGFYLKQLDSSNILLCKKDIKKAQEINPDLPDIEIARGFYYYYCKEEYENALEHFRNAALRNPNDYRTLFYLALVHRRLGNWSECLKLIQKVTKSDPKESLLLTNIGMTYAFFHKFDSAIIYHQKAIDQTRYWSAGYKNKFEALILKNGPTSEAQKLISNAIKNTGDNMIEYRIQLLIYQKKYDEALNLAEEADLSDFDIAGEKYLYLAKINTALNNNVQAIKNFEQARLILVPAVKNNPRDIKCLGALGLAYAGLKKNSKSVETGKEAILIASEKNKMDASDQMKNLAQIYTMTDDYKNAFPLVAFLLNDDSFLSKELLKCDPVWKPLLDDPEYKKKIRKL